MISTPLLISCGPLSPDPLAGVLPTSQDEKSSPARGREGDRKAGRERKRERGERGRERKRERLYVHTSSFKDPSSVPSTHIRCS